ncbi:9577_t:CDS:2, partial [Acaulospora colombiana]
PLKAPKQQFERMARMAKNDLLDAWSEITEPNVKLGKIRVYTLPDGGQVVRLFWQPSPDAPMIEYDLEMQEKTLTNYIVVTDRPKTSKPDERARTTEMKGAIEHLLECQPRFDVDYQAHLKRRHDAAQPQGGIKFMEDMGATTSEIRRLNAGRGTKAAPGTGIGKPLKAPKQQFERMARMAKNDLLDALFHHFRQKTHWSIKELRQKVQQPEVYLREVLNEIAVLERSGPNNGMYRLTENYSAVNVDNDDEEDEEIQMKVDPQQYSQLYKMEPALDPDLLSS